MAYQQLEATALNGQAETEDISKVFEWMEARAELARHGVLRKLYHSFVDDVLQQRKDMPVSLTASTKRADDALRKAAELEVRVSQIIENPERDEETLKGSLNFYGT